MLYVNVYRVERCFGGREEGGWWFDAGEVLESIPCVDSVEAGNVKAKLETKYAEDQPRFNRFSAAGGADICVWIEDSKGENFPKERPTYS